jgi:tetratricopeptide (TPR) repeat protein
MLVCHRNDPVTRERPELSAPEKVLLYDVIAMSLAGRQAKGLASAGTMLRQGIALIAALTLGSAIIGQMQPALADCNAAPKLRPNAVATIDSRGFVYLKMKNDAAAIADYNTALKIRSDIASSLYGRGLTKAASGDSTGSDADIAAAKTHDPTIAEEFAGWGVPGK